jgi:hypothetical protein
MDALERRNIDWSRSEIEDATLTVQLTGASSKAWKQRFEGVLALLQTPHSRWGQVRIAKNGVQVSDVTPGTETELHHFLESIVLQVNSELPEPEPEQQDDEEVQIDEAGQADRQMTAAFRAFADDHEGARNPSSTTPGGPTMAKDHGSSVKDDKQYEGLRKKGMSKERAAKIANTPGASKRGGKSSGSGTRRKATSQGGTRAQKAAAGRKGAKKAG